MVVSDDELVKVHVHTNHPGLAFEKALTYGSLSRMKIDNMREEHRERVIMDAERLARTGRGSHPPSHPQSPGSPDGRRSEALQLYQRGAGGWAPGGV